ncbi:dTDP-4-dehydrorhamnose reductase [Polynucleobacter brandtiae]
MDEKIMKVILFGKDGQLGRAFQALLSERFDAEQLLFLGRAECDLTDTKKIEFALTQFEPKIIINAAAYTAVDQAEKDMEAARSLNELAPACMARYAAHNQAQLLHFSTDYVFDGSKVGWYEESYAVNPLSVYGKTKLAGERAIISAFGNQQSEYGGYQIFRTSWVYGDGGNFIRTILKLAKERSQLRIIADQFGVPTSAGWLADMSFALGSKPSDSGIYHAVPSGDTSWYGLAVLVIQSALDLGVQLACKPEDIKPIPATEYSLPAPRPANSKMATDKLRLALGKAGQDYVFPEWQGQVKMYVQHLATQGLI